MLKRIEITKDTNKYGERAFLVHCHYVCQGHRMCVPDDSGWPTLAEAVAEAERIGGGRLEPIC